MTAIMIIMIIARKRMETPSSKIDGGGGEGGIVSVMMIKLVTMLMVG